MSPELPVYVVNLARRPDRRQRMESQLLEVGKVRFTSDWPESFDGELGQDLLEMHPRTTLFDWEDSTSPNPWYARPLKWGEVGCALAHIACWEHFLRSGEQDAIILEDDAVLDPEFSRKVSVALRLARELKYDLLYLGRVPQAPDRAVIGSLVRPGYSHCTYGYVLSSRGARSLVSMQPWRGLIPIDEFLPAAYCSHPRADIRSRFEPCIEAFACDPDVVLQEPKTSAGSDTENSDFVRGYEVES